MNIRTKLTMAFLSMCLTSLLIAFVIASVTAGNAILSGELEHLEAVAKIQKERTKSIVTQNIQRVQTLSSRTQLLKDLESYLIKPSARLREEMNANLNDALSSIFTFEEISVMDADGIIVASTDAARIGNNLSGEGVFLRGLTENYADILFLDEDGNLMVYVGGPLYWQGKQLGIVSARAISDDIVEMVSDYSGLGDTGETLLAQRNEAGDALFISPLRFDPDAALVRTVSKDEDLPITRALAGIEGLQTNTTDYRNEPVLAATQYLPGTDWGLVTKKDRAEAMAAVARLRYLFFGVASAATLAIVLLSIYFANNISRPIKSLSRVASEISSGNIDSRASVTTNDEVGILGTAFNQMANQLVNTNLNLEQQVAERTVELESEVKERDRLFIELQDKTEELERIIYVTSHDLRSPLVNIQGFTGELELSLKELIKSVNSFPDESKDNNTMTLRTEIQQSLGYITSSTVKIDSLLNGLLKISRLGRAVVTPGKLDINQVVNDVLQVAEFRIKELDVNVQVDDLPPCFADLDQVNQVFSNIIDNALKYLEPDRPGAIHISGQQENGLVTYCVEDNGIGIPSESRQIVFEIFHRLDPDTGSGDGMGLAIVQRLVQRNYGRVWIESEPGEGSKFFISLPIADRKEEA